jgi:hypothetical protein
VILARDDVRLPISSQIMGSSVLRKLILALIGSTAALLLARKGSAKGRGLVEHTDHPNNETAPSSEQADPLTGRTTSSNSRQFFLAIGIMWCVFVGFGVHAFNRSQPRVAAASNPTGGIVVLTSIKGMTVDASTVLNTGVGVTGTSSAIELSLRFKPITRAAKAALVGRRGGFVFPKPFRFAVIFSGSSRLAFGEAARRATGAVYPQIECPGCPDLDLFLSLARLLHKKHRRLGEIPTHLPIQRYFSARPHKLRLFSSEGSEGRDKAPLQFSPAVHGAVVGDAFGYKNGRVAIVNGTATIGGALTVAGALETSASIRRDGREQGAFIALPAAFPRDVSSASDAADGTFLILPAPRSSSFELEGTPGRLYAVSVHSDRVRLKKDLFDRMDFSSPVATVESGEIRWPSKPTNAPFTWQVSSDAEITAATGRVARNSLLAGILLGFGAALGVLIIERAIEQWRVGRKLARVLRGLAAALAVVFTLVGAVAATADNVTTITAGGTTITFSCPGPLRPFHSRAGGPQDIRSELRADCVSTRQASWRIPAVTGFAALVLWLYLAWSGARASGRLLRRTVRETLTVVAYGLGSELLAYGAFGWKGGLRGGVLLVVLLAANLIGAYLGARRVRRMNRRRNETEISGLPRDTVVISVIASAYVLIFGLPTGPFAAGGVVIVGVVAIWLPARLVLRQAGSRLEPG